MKKFLIFGIALAAFALMNTAPAMANGQHHKTTEVKAAPKTINTAQAEFDAPMLIGLKQISPDLFLGVGYERPFAENLFDASFSGVGWDEASVISLKVTYYGCWFNCPEQ